MPTQGHLNSHIDLGLKAGVESQGVCAEFSRVPVKNANNLKCQFEKSYKNYSHFSHQKMNAPPCSVLGLQLWWNRAFAWRKSCQHAFTDIQKRTGEFEMPLSVIYAYGILRGY